jgi:exodeoxyribonuclease-3
MRFLSMRTSTRASIFPDRARESTPARTFIPCKIARVLERDFTLVSWNVNSVRARLALVLRYAETHRPDVICLQETRLDDAEFPRHAFEKLGFHVATHGRGRYAGVAIATREPIDDCWSDVAGFREERPAGRRILCRVGGLWLDTVYVPTRKKIGKVAFLDALRADHVARFRPGDDVILAGDFNICFDERDLASPTMITDAELHPARPEDHAFRRLVAEAGLVDCFRTQHPEAGNYSWFPLTPWALKRNYGMRLDYVFATAAVAARVRHASHDREPRTWERPSDHLPVRIAFAP